MRIHEIIEQCVEYIAYDGTIGSDPIRLIEHLKKVDPSLDNDYFTHLWTLLCDHPSIQVVITNEPILLPGGTNELGTAPLPEGWIPPQGMQANVDISTLYREGLRGRQIAFMLAGQEFRSDKQAVQDKRDAAKKRAIKARGAASKRSKEEAEEEESDGEVKVDPSGAGTLRIVHVDDGQEGDTIEPLPKSDLTRLWEKWGARLRIRCTEDEIYYRLTGSHQKINKITSTVFHVLQIAAMSREKGVTAIDLGPLVGASQGSMHYYMKVLVQLGLCAKIPAILHAAVTNLLVFHRFLDQNYNYRALIGKPLPVAPTDTAGKGSAVDAEERPNEQDSEDEQEDPSNDPTSLDDLGLDFPPLTEADLMAGHVVKQRLLQILDSSKLKNHILGTKNLLEPLGWTDAIVTRHRRSVIRHIDALVHEGTVERVYIGESRKSCIRLSKYNTEPAQAGETAVPVNNGPVESMERDHDLDAIIDSPAYATPLNPDTLNLPLTVTFEHWIIELVVRSNQNSDENARGMTINAIWRNSNYMYKRSIDFAILRFDNAHVPEHIWPYSISSFMETIGKERRLRLFTTAEFQRIMHQEGQEVQGYPAMPQPDTVGDFGDISFKPMYTSETQLVKFLDNGKFLSGETSHKPVKKKSRPFKSSKSQRTRNSNASDEGEGHGNVENEFKYSSSVQVRGRPRKYIHVVEENGKINRRIIGTIYSRDDLPQVLVYLKERNILVTPPDGYSGLGPPPPASEEAIKAGHPPEFYYNFPAKDLAAFSGLTNRKSKAKDKATSKVKGKGKGKTGTKVDDANVEKGTQDKNSKTKEKGKRGKKRSKGSTNGSGAEETTPSNRKSKRQKKEVKYADAADQDLGEADVVIVEVEGVQEQIPSQGPVLASPSAALLRNESTTATHDDPLDGSFPPAPSTLAPLVSPEPDAVTNTIDENVVTNAEFQAPSMAGPSAVPVTDPPSGSAGISVSAKTPARSKSRKVKELAIKETAEIPKRPRQSRKTKAAAVPSEAPLPTSIPLLPSSPRQVDPQHSETSPSTPGSRFFPIDVPDEPFLNMSMEDSIGTVLAELSQSGTRPLPRPDAAAIASNTASANAGPAAVADGSLLKVQTNSKKRKAPLQQTHNETPTKAPKPKKGKTGTPKSSAAETLHAKESQRESLFTFPETPLEEMPFELPEDIVASTKPGEEVSADHANHTGGGPEADSNAPTPTPLGSLGESQTTGKTSPPPGPARADNTPLLSAVMDDCAAMPPPPVFVTPSRPTNRPNSTFTPHSRSATPLREVSAASHSQNTPSRSSRAVSSTPSQEVKQPIRNIRLHQLSNGTPKGGRIDLGSLRKANEIMQVLNLNGGVILDTRLIHEHRDWANKYAGTDHPYAPAIAYGMDRLVIKKTVNTLMNEGRLKETIVTVPTPTGRWVRSNVIYLSDLPHEQLQAYIRQMSNNVSQAITPTSKKDRKEIASLPSTPFTELKRSATKPVGKIVVDATPNRGQGVVDARPFSERRTALLKEIKVIGQLYGWRANRSLRVQVLHRAIVKALASSNCGSVVSSSPRIFAFPLLAEEITAGEWFACCLVLRYNEEVEYWLRDPANRAMKVKDVPKRFRPPGGFGGSNTKQKMNTLLLILMALKIISPVTPVDKDQAEFFGDNSATNGYKTDENIGSSVFYVLHDLVPVYHLASVPPPLLGLLPARTEADLDTLWSTIKRASLELQVDALGRVGGQTKPGFPHTAKISDILEISAEYVKLFTRPKRWREEFDLLPIQKAALDEIFDWQTGQTTLTTLRELEDLAYENALPLPFIQNELKRRAGVAKDRSVRIAERLKEQAVRAQERQQKIQDNVRQKLRERQEEARKSWEEKVAASAAKKGVMFDMPLLVFVSGQTLQNDGMKGIGITDQVIDHWVMIWDQIKLFPTAERERFLEERRRLNIERNRAVRPKTFRTTRKAPKKKQTKANLVGPQKRTRSKRKWNHDDDELMLDAEAIIRARSRDNGYKGRAAMEQLFPGFSSQTFRARFRNITVQPGKQAYFDRLEQAWYEIWISIRGTDELQDDNQDSSIEFDLKNHVKVLREKIDKRPLRLLAASTPIEEKDPAPDLLADPYQIAEEYQWINAPTEQQTFDQVANSLAAEEIRINLIGGRSLLEGNDLDVEIELETREMGILQAALKIIVGTPDSVYDADHGKRLLDNWPNEVYKFAFDDLLNRNIVRKNVSRTSGRGYEYSTEWNALKEGFLPSELKQDSQGLIPKLEREEGIEWPLIGKSGELAALMDMVSNHQVNFDFDVIEFPTVKYERGHYNTRKLDDDAFEFPIQVKRLYPLSSPTIKHVLPDLRSCKPLTPWNAHTKTDAEIKRTLKRVLEAVTAIGSDGITKPELVQALGCSSIHLSQVLSALTAENQQVFWTGYDTARLVLREHWRSWTIIVRPAGEEEDMAVNPRRWCDLSGRLVKDDFDAIAESVKSLIVIRPGITHKMIREKFLLGLDRLELVEVLEHLLDGGKIRRDWSEHDGGDQGERILPPVEATDQKEEDEIGFVPIITGIW
ncbi:uncharacterized protein IL334_002836 [Kwoniella shivajii]|uniref:Myb-like domain-containing protein n=1 Tax=Kwoniella shivajii TaxID=564305 RepID=A0ABZ1CXJ1_9TREE|nr:hypothetical protein IL334_002836 [Kwoniella shivajii]